MHPPLRVLVRRHKAAVAIAAAIVLVLVGLTAVTAVSGSSSAALTDSTSCSEWTSAPAAQQSAYAQLYVNEHGVPASGTLDAGTVEAEINGGCSRAAYLGEADEITVAAAIKHQF